MNDVITHLKAALDCLEREVLLNSTGDWFLWSELREQVEGSREFQLAHLIGSAWSLAQDMEQESRWFSRAMAST